MNFTLQRGKRYKSTITLGFVERIASNDIIADKFRAAGFTDVRVTGQGDIRHAEGVWNADDIKPTFPPQISDLSEVVA
jgi:transketolase N-terminal domain/subunit